MSNISQKIIKVSIPLDGDNLSPHFGHCTEFLFAEIDADAKKILKQERLNPPPHEPGVLPNWLSKLGANVIISGGMGIMAQQVFEKNGIKVVVGVNPASADGILKNYIAGTLKDGNNLCDH